MSNHPHLRPPKGRRYADRIRELFGWHPYRNTKGGP